MSFYGTVVKAFFGASLLIVSGICALQAKPEISDRSPDKKYSLWQDYADKQPYLGDVKLIEAQSGKPVITLDTQVEPFRKELLWSKDSQRFAYFSDAGPNGTTRIFYRNGTSFDEIKSPPLPALPQASPSSASKGEDTRVRRRVAPIRWSDTGELVVENELISNDWGRSAAEVTLAIDPQRQASVVKSEEEPKSVVDYFLLLPAVYFEGPPSIWLAQIRDSSKIDKKNGFMHSSGDGAQPEFEVALFRYRDGHPLLALCGGELEGDDDLYLHFFELGPDGKMKLVNHWMFPVSDGGYDPESGATKADWEFHLPRSGKTIVIKTHKSHKSLYKVTWNGEKFERGK
jgi:hypothetical protein